MKLFFLTHANSVHSHRWIRYFAEHTTHTIHWISTTSSIDEWFIGQKNVHFYTLKKPFGKLFPLTMLGYIAEVRCLAARIKPDIIHAHYAGVNGLLAALCNAHPFIMTAWGSDVLLAGNHFFKKHLVSLILHAADLITCDAYHMKKAIMNIGIPESKITIIQFGIDTKKFIPQPCNSEILKKLSIQENAPRIISMRNFEPIYDLETLINAIPLVLKKYPSAIFLLGGHGSQKEYLERRCEELNIRGSVIFLGFINNAQLPQYLSCADIYVSTSLSDAGIASSTAEAMACGIPVIVTDSGENKRWINDEENGFIIPIKNPSLLTEKIIYLLENQGIKNRIGINGRMIVEERNDYWNEMKKMSALYTKLYQHERQ